MTDPRIAKLNKALQDPELREALLADPGATAQSLNLKLSKAEIAEIQEKAADIRRAAQGPQSQEMPQMVLGIAFGGKTDGKLR